jgi:hypothetical protein
VLLPQQETSRCAGNEHSSYVETKPSEFARGATRVLRATLLGTSLLIVIYSSKQGDYFLVT